MTSLSGEDRFVYIRSAFFVTINVFDSVEMHVFLNFIILGRGLCPSPDTTPSFLEIKFYFKNVRFY